MLPYNKRPKSDSSSNSSGQTGASDRGGAQDDDLAEETLLGKDRSKSDALGRSRARGNASNAVAGGANVKEKGSGSLDRPRLFQDSLSEDDVTRLMPSTRDVNAAASPSKPTAAEFARVRPAAGKRDVELTPRQSHDDELATNVFDQPAPQRKGGLAQGRRPVLASSSKATLLEPVPGFMDGSDERATITNEGNDDLDDDRTVQNPDTGERAAYASALESADRAKRAPAAFARVEPINPVTTPHPFAPRPATPLAAQSGPVAAVPLAPLSDQRIDAGTSVTGSTAAVSEGRSMGAWAVAFAAVVLLVAGGAFAALKNPGGGSEAAVSLVDPMAKVAAAAAQPLPPAPQVVPVAPPVLPQQVSQPQPLAQPNPEPPAALPVAAAPSAPHSGPVEAPHGPSLPAKGSHHAASAPQPHAPPAQAPVAAAPRAPAPAAAAPKAPKEPKKGGGMSDEEKKLSDEAKALADKQLQQSL